MLSQSTLVKDQIYRDTGFLRFSDKYEIEAGSITSQSFLLAQFFIAFPTTEKILFECPDLAFFSVMARYFGLIKNEIQFESKARTIFSSERESLESNALKNGALRVASLEMPAHVADPSTISLIIPHRNRSENLMNLLLELNASLMPPLEVIIGDDHSLAAHKDRLEFFLRDRSWSFPVHFFSTKTTGASAVRNELASRAQGSVLAFIDDDNTPTSSMLSYFSRLYADENFDIFVGPYERLFLDSLLQPTSLQKKKRVWLPIGGDLHLGSAFNCLGDMNFCVKKDFYFEMGGLDSAGNLAAEDWDFLYRSLMAGGRIGVIPEILQIYRDHSASFFKKSSRALSESRVFGRRSKAMGLSTSRDVELTVANLRSEYDDPMILDSRESTNSEIKFGYRFRERLKAGRRVRLIIPDDVEIELSIQSEGGEIQKSQAKYGRGIHWLDLSCSSEFLTVTIESLGRVSFGFDV